MGKGSIDTELVKGIVTVLIIAAIVIMIFLYAREQIIAGFNEMKTRVIQPFRF
jgi:hypothetical protein